MSATAKRYFGTDGIRGPVGGPLINPVFAARVGWAAGRYLREQGIDDDVFLARDTRASGVDLCVALGSGLDAHGICGRGAGILPTPGLAWGVRTHGAALGIVVTASHNPATDNGIKFFGPDGQKLSDATERHIEGLIDKAPTQIPRIESLHPVHLGGPYRAFARSQLEPGALEGMRIFVDCAHGATGEFTPEVLRELGATVVRWGAAPDGTNINDGCGSEHPAVLEASVRATQVHLGIAHDGDGDRVIFADERGAVLDGDAVLALLGRALMRQGRLEGDTIVATVMSNLGLERAMAQVEGRVERVAVGDRYVVERLCEGGYTFGGESSGHLVVGDISRTGDGLLAALEVLRAMRTSGKPLSELAACFEPFPQQTLSIRVKEKVPLPGLPELQATMTQLESELAGKGRLLVRYSGTEPKIRLLVEAEEAALVATSMERLAQVVRKVLC